LRVFVSSLWTGSSIHNHRLTLFLLLGVAEFVIALALLAEIVTLVGVVGGDVGQVGGEVDHVNIVLGIEVAGVFITDVEKDVGLGGHDLAGLGIANDVLIQKILVSGLESGKWKDGR